MQGGTRECSALNLAGIDNFLLIVDAPGFSEEDALAAESWAQRVAENSSSPKVVVGIPVGEFDGPILMIAAIAAETPHGERNAGPQVDVMDNVEIIRTGRAACCSIWKEGEFHDVESIDRDTLITSLNQAWQLFLDAWQRAPAELAAFEAEVRDEPTDLYPPSEN